jgi:hypothetical protein
MSDVDKPFKRMVPGYKSVLVNVRVKENLTTFRRKLGYIDSHWERCLVSAAIDIVLSDEALKQAWLTHVDSIRQEDQRLVLAK